ncbi:MAG: 16S rRNA (guanine(966)-N(2))-methyltransferase RsmD [Woeseiaceae bacterium]|nr:16S rRNA (guanine(966)-N(2))-methyltransferase RsmD [Woeseiaceae bacterium]
MRIVAGKWRGRLLEVADADTLRPTGERLRETLFNWLAPRIEGARCLDLFAGSGALGFEALSRGAASAVLVDADAIVVRRLRENAKRLSADGVEIVRADARQWLESQHADPFDIVFLDPPYADDSIGELCRLMARSDLLVPGARVYFEQPRSRKGPELPEGWSIDRDKTAGAVRYALVAVGQRSAEKGGTT